VNAFPVPAPAATVRAPVLYRPGDEPLQGYRLIAPLGCGTSGEVWKCEAPGGVLKALKALPLPPGPDARGGPDVEALQRLRSVRHRGLLFLDRVKTAGDSLVVVMELAEKSLRQVLTEWQSAGSTGLRREVLLGQLREVAEALDALAVRDLYHLNVKPENLLLAGGRVKVGDLGFAVRRRALLGDISPYAAPELRLGIAGPATDQYGLALVYHELLTGGLPRDGSESGPDLGALPEGDREVVGRALLPAPHERYPSCVAFVEALAAPPSPRAGDTPRPARTLRPGGAAPAAEGPLAGAPAPEDTPPGAEASPDAGAATCPSLPGYRFLACAGRRGASETWVALMPDGRSRQARLLQGLGDLPAARVAEALQQLTALSDPALPRYEKGIHDGSRVVLVEELPGPSLRQRLADRRAQRLPGIPRPELIAFLAEAAEALDRLYDKHGIAHLGLNPDNLVQQRGRVVLLDYGMASLFWLPAGQPLHRLNRRYAAPELARGEAGRAADVYSLGLIYQELLTGMHPWGSLSRDRDPNRRHGRGEELLPAADRAVLARALHDNPRRRFTTCTELVRALEESTPRRQKEADPALVDNLAPVIIWPSTHVEVARPAPAGAPTLRQLLPGLIGGAAGSLRVREYQNLRFVIQPDDCLQYRCAAWLPPGVAHLKLESFLQQWRAQRVQCDATRLVCHIDLPARWWDRYLGRDVFLEVAITLRHPEPPATRLTEVRVELRARGGSRATAGRLLGEAGPRVLESLRAHLQACPEQRGQLRLTCAYPLRLATVQSGLHLADPVECRSKDISAGGIGFFLPGQPTAPRVYLNVADGDRAAGLGVLARIVRVRPRDDGWYEVGAAFPPSDGRT
jgi:serine/threonine protein kinase